MTQPLTIHQYHYTAAPHDAISNYMLWIQQSLKKSGIGGEIFASRIAPHASDSFKPFSKTKLWNCDLLLVHHSQGNPHLKEVLQIEVPKAVIYNNITPPEFFKHDPHIQKLCQLGRKQLKALKENCEMGFGTSDYNLDELKAYDFLRTEKLPLLEIPSQPEFEGKPFSPKAPVHLLFVGRIARHKNQALLIKAFYYLKDRLPTASSLTLVGKGDPIYAKYLRLLIKQLGLSKEVTLTGKVSDSELKDLYRKSTAFVCPSLHEGFCIPLVEAMKYSLPIFALEAEGVLETLGIAGLVFHTDAPNEVAAILSKTLSHPVIMETLARSSQERLKSLSDIHREEKLVGALARLALEIRGAASSQGAYDATF